MKGSKDSPLLKRYEGSFIVAYERKSFGEFTLPLSPIELVRAGKTDATEQPGLRTEEQEGPRRQSTRVSSIILPAERSPLEVLRNYQDEIKSHGGKSPLRMQGGGVRRRPGVQHRERRRQHEAFDATCIRPNG